jgi:hypothetical protein
MELIERTNIFIATLLRVISDGTINRWANDGVAQASRFWSTDPTVSSGIALAQLIAAMLSAIFVFILVVAFLRRRQLMVAPAVAEVPSGGATAFPVGPLRERWNEVVGHLDSPQEAEWKLAVLEADKVVDDALARTGFSGATFGDRLMNIAPGTLVSLDGLWWAHKVRNRLAHELDYFLRYTEARQAIGYYQQALEELQLL